MHVVSDKLQRRITVNALSRILLGLVMATSGAAISMGAFANTNSNQIPGYTKRSITVKYSDLDLARTAGVDTLSQRSGVDTLFDRLVMAGHDVCGNLPGFGPENLTQQWQNWRACYNHALDNAAAKIGNRQLSRMIDENTDSANARG